MTYHPGGCVAEPGHSGDHMGPPDGPWWRERAQKAEARIEALEKAFKAIPLIYTDGDDDGFNVVTRGDDIEAMEDLIDLKGDAIENND
jgi:hypothetical protein